MNQRCKGFTLVELMVAISVAAILFTVAVPSFREVALGSQLRSIANELAASAYLARSEAIKRNAVVRLCTSSNGTSCDDSAWSNGWIVLAGTAVIQQRQNLPVGYTVISGGAVNLRFEPTGFGATSAMLTVCRDSPVAGHEERVVTVETSGRASVRRTTAGVCGVT